MKGEDSGGREEGWRGCLFACLLFFFICLVCFVHMPAVTHLYNDNDIQRVTG